MSSTMFRACSALRASRCNLVTRPASRRRLHEYLVMVNDSRDITSLNLKQTFAGKVVSEMPSNPQTIFACQAESIDAVEKAIFRDEAPNRNAVRIFPLDTVHTSALAREDEGIDS